MSSLAENVRRLVICLILSLFLAERMISFRSSKADAVASRNSSNSTRSSSADPKSPPALLSRCTNSSVSAIEEMMAAVDSGHTIAITGWEEIQRIAFQSFRGNGFCSTVALQVMFSGIGQVGAKTPQANNSSQRLLAKVGPEVSRIPPRPTKSLLVKIQFNCSELFTESNIGTGNYVSVLYGIRFTAQRIGNIHVEALCDDAEQQKSNLILPWIMGYFPASEAATQRATDRDSTQQACGSFHTLPVQYMTDPFIRQELRRMAVALVGVPSSDHPSAAFVKSFQNDETSLTDDEIMQIHSLPSQPLFPNIELDDAVLHWRCGDLMTDANTNYGYVKYHAFSNIISPEAGSIGIITQPFHGGQLRHRDQSSEGERRCKIVINDLKDFLQEEFPEARVSIRNDQNETLPLASTRMIMANQSISVASTFSLFPTLATFGAGYIRKPDNASAQFGYLVAPRVDQLFDNIFLMDEPIITSKTLVDMWTRNETGATVLEWFRAD